MDEYYDINKCLKTAEHWVQIPYTKRITLYNAYWQHYFSSARKLSEFISQIATPLGYKTLFKVEEKYIVIDFIKYEKEN